MLKVSKGHTETDTQIYIYILEGNKNPRKTKDATTTGSKYEATLTTLRRRHAFKMFFFSNYIQQTQMTRLCSYYKKERKKRKMKNHDICD